MSLPRLEKKSDPTQQFTSLPFKLTSEQKQKMFLFNHLLCIPDDDHIIIYNTDTKSTKKLACPDICLLRCLPNVGFASFSYSYVQPTRRDEYNAPQIKAYLSIWHINKDEVKLFGTHEIVERYGFHQYHLTVASPDGRYLAADIVDRDYDWTRENHKVEIFLFDCVKLTKSYLPIPRLNYISREFQIVFSQAGQIVLVHPCGWFSIYNLKISQNLNESGYSHSLDPVLIRREFCYTHYDFYPSPNGKHWLLQLHFRDYNYFYFINAQDPASELQKLFSYPSGSVLCVQWLGDRIALAVRNVSYSGLPWHRQRHIRDTIEIHDLQSHQKMISDVTDIDLSNWFTITEKGELFVLQDDGQYQWLKLLDSSVRQCLTKHPKHKETPFIKVLENTPGVNAFSRDILRLTQDYAFEPMQSMFFHPRKTAATQFSVMEVRSMIKNKIFELQNQIQQTDRMLSEKKSENLTVKEDLQRIQLDQVKFDLSILQNLEKSLPTKKFRDLYSSSKSITSIKDCIDAVLKMHAAKQSPSYDLLEFFDSIMNSLGKKIISKQVSIGLKP